MKKLPIFKILIFTLFLISVFQADAASFSSVTQSEGCSFAQPETGKETQLVLAGAGLASTDKSYRCSCATTSRGRPPFFDVFVENADGTRRDYYLGNSTDAAFATAVDNCFNSNTNRF
jgi:hypothetical protein